MAHDDRYKRLRSRYEVLSQRAATGNSLVPDTAYADFLKEQDRNSLPHMVPDPTSPGAGKRVSPSKPRPLSANAIRERAQQSLDESSKRLKAIEDHMWQHRQQERDLRRTETDILKQRRQLQKTMKDYETKAARRQAREADTLLGKESDLVHYQQKDLHQREEATKEHTRQALAGRQRLNEQTKKFMKTENQLSWRYQSLLQSLERKRAEVEQMSSSFESRIRAKEEEQHRLKQELASLAISLNMESQKRRQLEAETERAGAKQASKEIQEVHTRKQNMKAEERSKDMAGTSYENTRRSLEQTLKKKQERAQAQHRQEGRHLLDVRAHLQHNTEQQWFAHREEEALGQDMRGKEIQRRLQVVEARHRAGRERLHGKVQERNARELREWEQRFVGRENEARRREHQERLKHLSKVVSHQEGLEHALYSQAREAEAQRKKQDQVVEKLQTELETLKRSNAKSLKEAAIEAQKAEMELQQKIVRETAELTKAGSIREENLRNLSVHQHRSKEDKRMLAEERREHDRRVKIANRTALLAQTL